MQMFSRAPVAQQLSFGTISPRGSHPRVPRMRRSPPHPHGTALVPLFPGGEIRARAAKQPGGESCGDAEPPSPAPSGTGAGGRRRRAPRSRTVRPPPLWVARDGEIIPAWKVSHGNLAEITCSEKNVPTSACANGGRSEGLGGDSLNRMKNIH